MTPRVLLVAGLDPTGGAGLTADLAVLRRASVDGVVAATAVTVQDAGGVALTVATPAAVVEQTIRVLARAGSFDAIKIGMLATRDVVRVLCSCLREIPHGPVVLDPVLASGTGAPLLEPAAIDPVLRDLVPQVDVLTPNASEAATLARCSTANPEDLVAAAHRLRDLGARAVLVKGGHRAGDPDDLWVESNREVLLTGRRIGSSRIHGAGCALASWIAAGLALGQDGLAAARRAKAEVAAAIERAEVQPNGVRCLRW